MVGWLVPRQGGWRTRWGERQVMGLPLVTAEVPVGRGMERRWVGAARRLRQAGCRRVITPPDFSHWAALRRVGLAPVAAGSMTAALAAPLVLKMLEQRSCPPLRASVLLRGRRVDQSLFQAALALCPQVRRLAVWAGPEGEALSRDLHRRWGLPVVERGADWRADVTVEFARPESPADLILWGERPALGGLTLGLSAALPAEAEPLSLLALLWETRRIALDDIEIFTIPKVQMT